MRALILLLACTSLPTVGIAEELWCWNVDQVLVQVNGDRVRVDHLAALLNCCPDPITYHVEVGDVTVFIEERSETQCYCDCCFNLDVTLEDFPSGPWVLRYRWFDIETDEWTEREFQIEVPDLGQPYVPYVAAQNRYGCLETSDVPEEEPPADRRSWGKIKAGYR